MTATRLIKSKGCTEFSRRLIFKGQRFEPYPYQRKLFAYDLTKPTTKIAVQAARQTGKSIAASIAILFSAITNPHTSYFVFSRTRDQAGIIYEYIRDDFLSENPWLRYFLHPKKSRQDKLVFKNGSTITSKTASNEAKNARGFHISRAGGCLVWDEASYLSNASYAALTMMGHSAAELMVSSPRWKTGFFYDCCTKKPLGYDVIKVPLSACPHWSADQIEDKRRKLTPGAFAMDCLAEFHQGENRVFPDEDILGAIDESLPLFSPACTFVNPYPDRSYSFGFDISKIGCDKWSLMIGDFAANHLTIRAYHNWMGTKHSTSGYNATYTDDPNEIQKTVVEYAKTFRPYRVYCDGTSNEYYCHELLNKCLLPVEQINWSAKERIIEHARTCFSAGRISIPNDPDLINELLSYSYDVEAMKDGESRILYIGGGEDDMVSALAMALTVVHADPEYSFNDKIVSGSSNYVNDLQRRKRQVPKRVVSLACSKRSLVRT